MIGKDEPLLLCELFNNRIGIIGFTANNFFMV